MAKAMGDLDSELLCAICRDELEDPRFLPCHHYFCAACIQNVADTAGALQNNSSFQKMAQILRRKSFPCPECRKNTVLPGNNARNLPQAFVVNRMKESLKKFRSKQPAVAPALNPSATAHVCTLHDIALKLLCLDCQQMICPECVLSTHKYHKYEYPDQTPSDYMIPVNQKQEVVHPEDTPTRSGDVLHALLPPRVLCQNNTERGCLIEGTPGHDVELQAEESEMDFQYDRSSAYRHKKKSSNSLPSSARFRFKNENQVPPVPPPRKQSASTFERHYIDTESEVHPLEAEVAVPSTYIADQSWYHFNTDRITAENMLNKYKKDGLFLIRDSSKSPGEFTLSIWYQGVKHMRISMDEDGYLSLQKAKRFNTLVDLVLFYKHETLLFKCGGGTILKYECPK